MVGGGGGGDDDDDNHTHSEDCNGTKNQFYSCHTTTTLMHFCITLFYIACLIYISTCCTFVCVHMGTEFSVSYDVLMEVMGLPISSFP